MANRPSRARLFVALEPPADAREALAEWGTAALGGMRGLRLVDRESLHVTLAFLGHLDEAEMPRVAKLMRPPDVPAALLVATGVRAVPPRRPRLFAVELEDEDGRAETIQAAVAGALADAGLYEPEMRPFWPHVTVARVKKGARVDPVETAPPPAEPWRAEAVTLYRSRLSRDGARYEAVARVELGD